MPGRSLPKLLISIFALVLLCDSARPQECAPPPITANSKIYNIFSPDQEMMLGDLAFQSMSGDNIRIIKDPEIEAYLSALGAKLVKHLPPTGLKFKFYLVDMPEANAFNIPGGYVFVSRKLIGFVHNEDELAGVMAHELGHATVHHAARDFSNSLKQVLNVTQLGDRKDVTEKYNLLLERARTKDISRQEDHESAQQLEADRIGLFAMVSAGYDPQAFTSFFDRLVETKGKTGNWFNDIFGKAKPEQKRLREMIKVSEELPAQCRENRAAIASEQFLKWQANVVSFRESARTEELAGLAWKKNLNPGLRSDISHFAFSPDGKYIIAQDDFAITVLKRDPLEFEFRIEAPEARDAVFSPDSQYVVFGTEGLRLEKWSIAEKKPLELRELVVRRDCWENEFSPDGKYLACVDFGLNLNIIETGTGKRVFEKKDFYELNFLEVWAWIKGWGKAESGGDQTGFFQIEYTPDGRYVLVSRSSHFRFRVRVNSMTVDQTENTVLALDLTTMKPVSVGGDIKKITNRAFAFIDSSRILGMPTAKLEDAGVFSFPEGKRLSKLTLGGTQLSGTGNPNYVVIKPLSNAKLGVYDIAKNAIITGMDKEDVSIWQNYLVYEQSSGKVVVSEFRYNPEKKGIELDSTKTIEIPAAAIGNLSAADVSDNFQWLAISSKTRGGLWSLSTGERKVYVRGFKGAIVSDDGSAVGEFPRLEETNHALAFLNIKDGSAALVREMEKGAQLYGRFVFLRESLKAPKKESDSKPSQDGPPPPAEGKSDETSLDRDVRMSLSDILNNAVVWTRDFNGEAPKYFFDKFSGRLIFYWTLGSDAGKARLKADPALAARAQNMGNKDDDYLLEVVDAFAKKTVGTILLETGKGSFDINAAYSEGDWLVLHDSTNRVLALTLSNGELKQRFFGNTTAINPGRHQIAVENFPGELSIYNLASGDLESRLTLGGAITFIRFSLDGRRLFALTSQQVAYSFEMDKLAQKPAPVGNK
jgi:hypothetical protein